MSGGQVLRGWLQLDYLIGDPRHAAWPIPISARLSWCCADPWLVSIAFLTGPRTEVRWGIGRELLQAGLARPVGVGDVAVLPDPADPRFAELILATNDGRCCLRFLAEELELFLVRVEAHLAYHCGHRQRPGDDELAALLTAGEV